MIGDSVSLPLGSDSLGLLNDAVFIAFKFGSYGNHELMPLLARLLESDEPISWEVRQELAAAIRRNLGRSAPGRPSIGIAIKGSRTKSAFAPQVTILLEKLKLGARVERAIVAGSCRLTQEEAITAVIADSIKAGNQKRHDDPDISEKPRDKIRKAHQYYRKMQHWLKTKSPLFMAMNSSEVDRQTAFAMHDLRQRRPDLFQQETTYSLGIQKKADDAAIRALRRAPIGK